MRDVTFAGQKGLHVVFSKVDMGLESSEFSLASLIEYCQVYLILRPAINFKFVLVNKAE